MKILVAKSAGFCYGVANAVKKATELVSAPEGQKATKIKTLGSLIHNETVVSRFAKQGVEIIEAPEEAQVGDLVMIRAHGVGEKVYEELKNRGADICDVTCSYVAKIQKLVNLKSKEGYVIVIVGDRNHPEVIGICGWVDGPKFVVEEVTDLENADLGKAYLESKGVCLVSQTTLTTEKWERIYENAQKKFEKLIKFDTICNATLKRQSEAMELARQVDAMFVIGSRSSSNTLKLVEVSARICEKTYLIEGAQDLAPKLFKYINTIGITAGASTPESVIEEVISKMSEINETNEVVTEEVAEVATEVVAAEEVVTEEVAAEEVVAEEVAAEEVVAEEVVAEEVVPEEVATPVQKTGDETFEEMLDQYSGEVRSGRIMKGTVSRITTDKIYVDLGGKFEGELPASLFEDEDIPAIGTEIDVRVNRVSEKDNAIHLSKGVDRFTKMLKEFTEIMEAGETLDAKIERAVKGGAIAKTRAGEVFIPLPLLADRYVEQADEYVGKDVKIKIISVDEKRRSVKASAKEHAMAQKFKALAEVWEKIVVGETMTGTVKNFTDFRAFVDLGGIDGSIHISEISWNRIKHPSDVLKIGDSVEVKVLDADKETRRISLTLKKAEENPWFGAESKFEVGTIIKGTVARIVPFGAFVVIEDGIDGLVHISQISDFRLAKVDEALKVGDEVECKIIEVDIPTQKISLSIKEVAPINPEARVAEAEARQKERDERDAERAKRNEEREASRAEQTINKQAKIHAKEEKGDSSNHSEDMVTTIGDIAGLTEVLSDKPTGSNDLLK
ncbi:MAG: bifunctional 4-hydroxy-3-methylbut-2-enyl diphosphate reductase/30S ribosomal protein S1 [Bacillota bacterium]